MAESMIDDANRGLDCREGKCSHAAERDRYRAKLHAACRERDEAYEERFSLVGERDRYREALVQVTEAYDDPKRMVDAAWEALDV
jgi:hypothetical protein